jgi:hypothetical protein
VVVDIGGHITAREMGYRRGMMYEYMRRTGGIERVYLGGIERIGIPFLPILAYDFK